MNTYTSTDGHTLDHSLREKGVNLQQYSVHNKCIIVLPRSHKHSQPFACKNIDMSVELSAVDTSKHSVEVLGLSTHLGIPENITLSQMEEKSGYHFSMVFVCATN